MKNYVFNYKQLFIGLVFTLLFLFSLSWIVDGFSGILDVAKEADYSLVLIGLLFYVFSLFARTFRWNFLLKNNSQNVNHLQLFPVVVVGYMFNNLLPMRTGEIARCYYLEHKIGIKKSFALGTVAIERISDVVSLSLILGFILILVPNSRLNWEFINLIPGNYYSFILLTVLLFLGSFLLIIAPLIRNRIKKVVDLFLNNSNIFFKKIVLFIEGFFQGYFSINDPVSLFKLILISFLVWSLEITMYLFIAMSVDLTLDNLHLLILTVLLFGTIANLAGIFPSTAGGWGSFDFFGVLVLISFGVSDQLSLGFVIFVHFLLWAPVTLVGLFILLKNWIPLKSNKTI